MYSCHIQNFKRVQEINSQFNFFFVARFMNTKTTLKAKETWNYYDHTRFLCFNVSYFFEHFCCLSPSKNTGKNLFSLSLTSRTRWLNV